MQIIHISQTFDGPWKTEFDKENNLGGQIHKQLRNQLNITYTKRQRNGPNRQTMKLNGRGVDIFLVSVGCLISILQLLDDWPK